jgi:uncharacterized phage protein gp47/JayE
MPDQIDSNGLQLKTLTEIREELEEDFRSIYGTDINIDQDAPDGQMINIFAQQAIDLRELLERINSSFDPEQAEGRYLDQRVALNAIKRLGGSFTFQDVDITVDRALTLEGLDGDVAELDGSGFTVKDDAGNEFILADTQTPGSAGTYTYSFRAKEIGSVTPSPNTITTPVTIVPGVTAINNPDSPSVVGQDEESDADLRLRRRASVSISAIGYLESIQAAIANIDGVTTSIVKENTTTTTDSDGVPAHSIWAIVEGGSDEDIAQALYARKSAGAGMFGAETVDITRPDGSTFTAKFDRPINQDLWIDFDISLSVGTVDEAAIKDQIVENVIWEVGADAQAGTITAFLKGVNSDYIITNMRVSDDGVAYSETVSVTGPQYRFVNATTRITINA